MLAAAGPVDAVWHLGDVVGYGPDPDGVVDRLAGIGAIGVAGNHDLAALGGPEIDWFNPDAKAAMEWTSGRIAQPTRAWLAALPTSRVEAGMTLVHGSPRDPIWEYVTSASIARASFAVLDDRDRAPRAHPPADGLAGPGGQVAPMRRGPRPSFRLDGRPALLNPGSVGQPRDGDPTASWLELDTDAGRRHLAPGRPTTSTPSGAAMRRRRPAGRLADRLAVGLDGRQ